MERPQALRSHIQACVAGQSVARNGVFGVRFTSELTKKHWKFGQEKSPAATSGTLPCCQILRTKSRPIRTSAALPQMGRMTPANAARRLPPETPMR
jgi:hypothetical protein